MAPKGPSEHQTLIVHLDPEVVREVREHLASTGAGYGSLNEFVEVALMNQLAAEAAARDGAAEGALVSGSFSVDVLRPLDGSPPGLADPPKADEALFVLTNRLGPIKVATRVLANLREAGDWPTLHEFQETAAQAARDLGLRLRKQDAEAGRSGAARRWVAFPVGADERAALDRFVFSFTMAIGTDGASGPMAVLGLANLDGDRVVLTEAGWALAAQPSPLIDEAPTRARLSPAESEILRGQVRVASREREAVDEFIGLVTRAAGSQSRLDELLTSRHQEWTGDLALAHRSAMLGRLGDVGALAVSGRGPKATIELLPAAEELRTNEEGRT